MKYNKNIIILCFIILLLSFIIINKFFKNIFKKEYFKNNKNNQDNSYYKIVNVYQEKYKNNVSAYGLGDFIRGCYFIIQYAKLNNKLYDIYFNHPIGNFLKNKYIKNNIPYNNIEYNSSYVNFKEYLENNYIKQEYFNDKSFLEKIKNFFKSQTITDGTLYVSSNTYPYRQVSTDERMFMKNKLEPSNEMENYIKQNLEKVGLQKNKYIIIHIRSGDKYLFNKNKSISDSFKNKIFYEIENIFNIEKNIDFLLMSDNTNIKKDINLRFNKVKYIDNDITHMGEGQKLEFDKIKNTLLDFYLMSYSSKIYSFTVYTHGSGFAQWCAITYNIPYLIKYIKE